MGTTEAPEVGADGLSINASTLAEAFQATVAAYGDKPALKDFGKDNEITWSEYADRVESIARGLHALGIEQGECVAMMMTNRSEFNQCDAAIFHLGATPFSIYNTSSPDQIEYLFGNAENKVVICEEAFAERLLAAKDGTNVETIICIDGNPEGTVTLESIEAAGDKEFDFEGRWRSIDPDTSATLIFTSGTTGPSKGVQLTHENLLQDILGIHMMIPLEPNPNLFSYLPSAHIADRTLSHYMGILLGGRTLSLANPAELPMALPEAHPHYFLGVPRVWEKLMAALQAKGIEDPKAVPDEVKAGVLAKLGLNDCRLPFSGAAPIPVEVLEFFGDLGLEICEGWGMSETSTVGSLNIPGANKRGTVGRCLPNAEVKVADDGELLIKGPMIMKGYRKMPEKTAETMDGDWLMTGDVVEIDDEGFIKIVDRKKELIINAAGKNMSPANIEKIVKSSHAVIGQALAIGDARKYVTALITLDPDVAPIVAEKIGLEGASIEELSKNEQIHGLVQQSIDAANEKLSRVEQVKKFTILPNEWMPGGDELTPTSKLKRKPIHAKYEAEIEALYAE